MQIEYFYEKYDENVGSVYTPCGREIMRKAEDMEFCDVVDAQTVYHEMTDYKDDDNYKRFTECLDRSNKVIIYGLYGFYPGDIANIYEIIMEV